MKIIEIIVKFIASKRFLRGKIRSFLVKLLFPLDKEPDKEFLIPFRKHMVISGNRKIAQEHAIYFYGCYEEQELDLIDAITEKTDNSICFDIGANTGQHTLVMAKNSSKVYAFEPFDAVRETAQRRVSENNFDNVIFLDSGLGNKNVELPFYIDEESSNNAMGSFIKGHDELAKNIGSLQIRIGDELVDQFSIDRLDLIKIDVEGLEVEVLEGLSSSINRFRPFVIFEISYSTFDNSDYNEDDIKSLFEKYQFFSIKKGGRPKFIFFTNTKRFLIPTDNFSTQDVTYNIVAAPEEKTGFVKEFLY